MITYLKNKLYSSDGESQKVLVEIACTTSDTKPTDGIVTGSLCYEVDSNKMYVYDEDRIAWTEIER